MKNDLTARNHHRNLLHESNCWMLLPADVDALRREKKDQAKSTTTLRRFTRRNPYMVLCSDAGRKTASLLISRTFALDPQDLHNAVSSADGALSGKGPNVIDQLPAPRVRKFRPRGHGQAPVRYFPVEFPVGDSLHGLRIPEIHGLLRQFFGQRAVAGSSCPVTGGAIFRVEPFGDLQPCRGWLHGIFDLLSRLPAQSTGERQAPFAAGRRR